MMSKTPRTDVETRLRSGQEVVLAGFARQLEAELAEERARNTILEGCINDMTEEQAAICAEGQSITELVAAKDKLIKQMREALDATDEYHLDKSYAGKAHNTPIVVKVREAQAALSAAERGE